MKMIIIKVDVYENFDEELRIIKEETNYIYINECNDSALRIKTFINGYAMTESLDAVEHNEDVKIWSAMIDDKFLVDAVDHYTHFMWTNYAGIGLEYYVKIEEEEA